MAPEPKGREPRHLMPAAPVVSWPNGAASEPTAYLHDLFGGIAPFWPGLVSEPLLLGAKTVIGCAFVPLHPPNRDRKALVHPERP